MKTDRKMMVRAFTKIAKRWEDSKTTPHSLRRYGFKDARAWGRYVAGMYSFNGVMDMPDAIIEEYEIAAKRGEKVAQADFDAFAEEEISCW